ncbi:transposase [Marinilabilia salmonicolor]|uniref:IS1634 family transposase n=1 Tax=Marinilabilia salmonicolor TaxID=989 RepID=UPI000D0708D1|nr:transposase [Marinilabilia salmonicolor]
MFIRAVHKKDKSKSKTYTYYRLTHSYRIGNKTRQTVLLNLGKLEGVEKTDHKQLANRIEEIITGVENSLFPAISDQIEELAHSFARQIEKEKIFPSGKGKMISKKVETTNQNVDLDSIEQLESRDIGGEWLVKQAFERLAIPEMLETIGLDKSQADIAQMLLTAKLIHPSSELETERWLNENSASLELYDGAETVSRYKLYKATTELYNKKEAVDSIIYNNVKNLFSGRDKIIIYDLTNMYFEGQMLSSKKADFGRSKQKRYDRRLIGLAISIDSMGFVRHSKFYTGNVSEPETFKDLVKSIVGQSYSSSEKPLVIMDAGISTEDNLIELRELQYDYVCVSRTIPKDYKTLSDGAKSIEDNRGNKIHLTKVSVEGKEDNFLHIKSDQKEIKERSMDEKMTRTLEAKLTSINQGLSKKGTVKKISKIHERVGGIKAKLSRIGWLYNITYTEDTDKDIVTAIKWERVRERERPKGEYFLRYTKNAIAEDKIWDAYNLTRDVEAVFRCLKTDLNIRPVHHQVDQYIEPHIWLGIIAYQVVNYIRTNLNQKDINYSWSTIVEKMRSMQSSVVTVNSENNEKLYIKLCTRPTKDQKDIFDALNFKHRPFVRKTKVVTQM